MSHEVCYKGQVKGLCQSKAQIKHSTFHETNQIALWVQQLCPQRQANEIHALYDRHHEVLTSPNPHLNASNSVKHEVIWK